MNKNELIKRVSDETGLTRKDVRIVFNSIFENIEAELCSNGKVLITGFGTFETVVRTISDFGMKVADKRQVILPVFRPGKNLKESIGGANGKHENHSRR